MITIPTKAEVSAANQICSCVIRQQSTFQYLNFII